MSLSETDITAELILRAFEVTGLRPVSRECYLHKEDTSPCGCAIGALALAFEVLDPSSYSVGTEMAVSALGIPWQQGQMVAFGFDDGMDGFVEKMTDPLYRVGYEAGRILRERAAVAR